jgi:uncharacterized protein (TIGR02145 family)
MKLKNRIWSCSMLVIGMVLIFSYGCTKADVMPADNTKTDLVDKDGNVYTAVTIGTQVWMAENLKTTKYNNGDPIETTTLDISNEIAPKYQWAYENNESYAGTYGRLYTWYTATESRNICPTGWHVPTDGEWETLKLYLGGDSIAGAKLKEAGTAHWQTPNNGTTNEVGFTALPSGYRNYLGSFVSIQVSSYLWSSSPNPTPEWSWGQRMYYNDAILLRGGYYKQSGASVRCLKD